MSGSLGLVVLAAAAFVAGVVNAIAGAGSLLTLPALVFTGLDASAANATNRVAILAQNVAALTAYERSGVRTLRAAWPLTLPVAVGAAAGAWVATLVSPAVITASIVAAMIVMLPLSLLPPRAADPPTVLPRIGPGLVATFLAVGFYAGFLQAGVGIVILLTLSRAHRVDLVTANGVKVLVILAATVVALGVFAGRAATIDLTRGAILAVATAAGGWVGARTAVARGARLVRWLVVASVLASAAKLAYDLARGG